MQTGRLAARAIRYVGVFPLVRPPLLAVLFVALAVHAQGAHAEETSVAVVIENHVFTPSEIHVKANQPNILAIENRDATAEEFDSSALKAEKMIAGKGRAVVRLRPLPPGRYAFDGEYHEDTAKGVVVAE